MLICEEPIATSSVARASPADLGTPDIRAAPGVRAAQVNLDSLEYDIRVVAKASQAPLHAVSIAVFEHLDLFKKLSIPIARFSRFVESVESYYCKCASHVPRAFLATQHARP
jgi:hypothetical protein